MADAFAELGVPAKFELDAAELERRFVALAAEHHPDRFADPLQQADAADRFAAVNEAYRVLRDPILRAAALLQLRGAEAQSDDKSLPAGFLSQMLELRERLEQAIDDQDEAELAALRDWAAQQRTQRLRTIAGLFEGPDSAAVAMELNALRYVQRMIDQTPALRRQ